MTDGERTTLADVDLDAIYVKSTTRAPAKVAHPDPDCRHLRSANNVMGPKDPAKYDDGMRVCMDCLGEMPEHHRNGPGGLWEQLEAMDADALSGD